MNGITETTRASNAQSSSILPDTIREVSDEHIDRDEDPFQGAPRIKLNRNNDGSVIFNGPRASRPSLSGTGRLSTHSLNFGIPTNDGARLHVIETHGEDRHWRKTILEILHDHKVQLLLMLLLLLDVMVLFTELFLLAWYPSCSTIERDCIACCGSGGVSNDEDHHRILSVLRVLAGSGKDDEHHHDVCEDVAHEHGWMDSHNETFFYHGEASCDEHKYERVHNAEFGLFVCTMLILSVFMLELHLEILALGPGVFFRQVFYTVDYAIVTLSFSLELAFHFDHNAALQSVVGLVIFARLWRFVRIGHGIIEITSELTHHQYEDLLAYTEKLEKLLETNKLALPEASKDIHRKLHHTESSMSSEKETAKP